MKMLDTIGRQEALDKLGDKLDQLFSTSIETISADTRTLRNLLHGTWLGHPLHPVLTDVAIGGWTVTVVLDLVNDLTHLRVVPGAQAALGIGLLGAFGSAVTGAADWQHTYGAPRRLGLVHAGLNAAATVLMSASFMARTARLRSRARWMARAGFGLATVSAYIGGDLVYRHRIGVSHAQDPTGPKQFTAVLGESELQEDKPHLAEFEGTRIVLVRHAGRIRALGEVCSHLGGPLSEGEIRDGGIVCPWHGSRFDLRDCRVLDGPATYPQPCFETRVRDGQIEVRALQTA